MAKRGRRKNPGGGGSQRRASALAKRARPSRRNATNPFPIVGIGASAGGLPAFEQFFANMPPDSGMAFVVVPHLDPDHASILPELLRKYTKMPVVPARDRMRVQPNHVYVLVPDTEMTIENGFLVPSKSTEPRWRRPPIDIFLRSLAEDRKERAICVILSGNGTDGTLGVKAIKAELGLVVVQEPATAEFDSMPRSAIETGVVDYVLPPEKMPEQLLRYIDHAHGPARQRASATVAMLPKLEAAVKEILNVLRAKTDHDFSAYKETMLLRRIRRRMSVHQLANIGDYLLLLRQDPQEVTALFKELLIGVTSFFRDPRAFEALARRLKADLRRRPADSTIRVWVPGCSTGEEVYSVAIVLRECMDKLRKNSKSRSSAPTSTATQSRSRARRFVLPALPPI